MFRSILVFAAGALLLTAADNATKKSAFDKPALEAYVRHLWVLDPGMKVEIGDRKPSELPGFDEVKIKISQGPASQQVALWVSKDGLKIVQGNVYDINSNPFKTDLDRLKTQFQPSLGTPGAPVVLIVYSDFECPYCKVEATMLRQNLLTAYPTQVRLYFRDYPLVGLHSWAKIAALAGRCVFGQAPGAFWEYHDFVFGQQDKITSPEGLKSAVMGWAKDRQDLDALQLGQCIDAKTTEAEVDQEIADGKNLEISGTPTLFINGRRIPSGVEWQQLKTILDNEIEYQKIAKNAGEDCGCDLKLNVPGLPAASPVGPPKKK